MGNWSVEHHVQLLSSSTSPANNPAFDGHTRPADGDLPVLADMPPDYQHPAFPQPSDLNAVIWRYLDIDKLISLVSKRCLYMARADLLGDDHEGTTPPAELAFWRMLAEHAEDEQQRRTIEHQSLERSEYATVFRHSYYVSCWHCVTSNAGPHGGA
jgi:hypothetical protein